MQITPGFPPAHAVLGALYLKTHQYQDAVAQLQQALWPDSELLRRDPILLAARYDLACAYSQLGKLEEAYRTLSELLTLQPQYASRAARDADLAALRDHPRYAGWFESLEAATRPD